MKMHELPEEILDLCCRFADKSTLRALRQTSQIWLPSATKRLFNHLELRSTDESAARCHFILESPLLNFAVTSLEFITSDGDVSDNRDLAECPDEAQLLESCKAFLLDIGGFQNLQTFAIRFAMDCAAPKRGRSMMFRQIRETHIFREAVLSTILEALTHENHPAKKVHSLQIKNLQDRAKTPMVNSPQFKSVLGQLDSLALQIATEYDETSPEINVILEEVHKFFNVDLKKYWLGPTQAQLVDLKLYATELEWGYFPACDLRELHFPKLRKLALGLMTFTHDRQLDWIVSHSETLESLTLDDCPIVTGCFMYANFDCDRNTPSRTDFKEARGEDSWVYNARWHTYFARIRAGIPKLKWFGFGRGPWDEHRAFQTSAYLGANLYRQRYCVFDAGIAPNSWVTDLAEVNGQRLYGCAWEEAPPYPDCDQEDQEALNELMITIEDRR